MPSPPHLPEPNADGTGYLKRGRPCFGRTFSKAGPFTFAEWLAAVEDESGAYHLCADGSALYKQRYLETTTFSEGVATVRDERGWLHINSYGDPIHPYHFRSAWPLQGGISLCTALSGHYVHVRKNGHFTYLPTGEPAIGVEEILRRHEAGETFALILRHAQRHKIAKGSLGEEVSLTGRGKAQAERLGAMFLPIKGWSYMSSPISRCIDTCASFARGHREHPIAHDDVPTSELLGAPGAFQDPNDDLEHLDQDHFWMYAMEYLDTGFGKGFRPLAEACDDIFDLVRESTREGPALLATHDLFVAGLFAFLSLHKPSKESWVKFLDGVCFFTKGDKIVEWRRFNGTVELR